MPSEDHRNFQSAIWVGDSSYPTKYAIYSSPVAPLAHVKYGYEDDEIPYNLAYKTPLCGPCETNAFSQGGYYTKGGTICQLYGTGLLSTNLPIRRIDSSCISGALTHFSGIIYTFLIKSTNISNQFMIAAQALTPILSSTPTPAILAPRASPRAKPLAKRQSLHTL